MLEDVPLLADALDALEELHGGLLGSVRRQIVDPIAPMRTPPASELHAPEFPRELEWVNVAFLRMGQLVKNACTLVEFWDFARINSLRTLPYTKAWHERYADRGLRVIGVHAPGYSFGRDPELARRAV